MNLVTQRLWFISEASYWVSQASTSSCGCCPKSFRDAWQALTTPHFPVHGGGLDHGLWTQEATTPLSKGHAVGPLKSIAALLSHLGSQTTSLRICLLKSL